MAEGIQVILRREGVASAYELLKDLSRRDIRPNREAVENFIANLNVKASVKEELRKLTPFTYTGILPHILKSTDEK